MITRLDKNALRPKVQACIDKYLALGAQYCLTVGIYRQGELYVLGDAPDALSLQYDIGSVSKTVTAHLLLSLAEQGLLSTDQSVDRYLPLPKGSYPTVSELMTHTAGYGHLTPLELTLPSLIAHGYARKNVYEGCTSSDVLRCLARRRHHRRASGYGYSDFAYAVLAVVAEHVTGKPFSALVEDFLHEQLGMTHTVIKADPAHRTPPAVHRGRTLPFWRWERENPYLAGGGLVSDVADMLRYVAIQIESEEPFIKKAHSLCAASVSSKRNVATCTGWHTYKKSHQLWHVGGVGTFRSSVIVNRHNRFGVVVLGNAKGVASANVHYLAKMLYSEFKIKKIDFTKTLSESPSL